MCAPCGAQDQACCGDGPAARRRCNAGLGCQFKGGAAFLCEPPDGTPDAAAEAGPDLRPETGRDAAAVF
jgi:hypothetical protein